MCVAVGSCVYNFSYLQCSLRSTVLSVVQKLLDISITSVISGNFLSTFSVLMNQNDSVIILQCL